MRSIDRFAYHNRIRKLDPAYKAGFSLTLMLVCLIVSRPAVSTLAVFLAAGLSILWARLPARFVFRLLTVEAGFLAFAVLGVAVSITTSVVPGGIPVGPFLIRLTAESIFQAGALMLRALGCAAAMNFLALTTPMVDLIELMRRLHVSEVLIDLMTLIYRFIFTLFDSLEQMVLAEEVRFGFNGWQKSIQSAANIGANLFIEAYRRSRRLEMALEGRGWDGNFRVLPQTYESIHFPWK